MTVEQLIKRLKKLNPKSEVRFIYGRLSDYRSIGVGGIHENDTTVYISECYWETPIKYNEYNFSNNIIKR